MKTDWDYTTLAEAYVRRPDYSGEVVRALVSIAGVNAGDVVCDVGAGVAHLTLMLAQAGLVVDAVEPNDAMRNIGSTRTRVHEDVRWFDGVGEATGRPSNHYGLVTFGSSFNVCDRAKALVESKRMLRDRGWFACLWNHRNLEDPIQNSIENIIKSRVPGYGYGSRREDQTAVIEGSGLFEPVVHVSGSVIHRQSVAACVEAWRSHATLERQAGESFPLVIGDIHDFLHGLGVAEISIPYTTNSWIAQLRA